MASRRAGFWAADAYGQNFRAAAGEDVRCSWLLLVMHSRVLRGEDFSIRAGGMPVKHSTFFQGFSATDRLALLTPMGGEGLGAACLLMGFVTAYYDHWRREGGASVRYPEFFTLQSNLPCADYCMLDIWPYHRNLYFSDLDATWRGLAGRGVRIVIVPDSLAVPASILSVADCYAYSQNGTLANNNLEIGLACHLARDYLLAVIDSLPAHAANGLRNSWQDRLAAERLVQQFRKIGAHGAVSQG